MEEQLGIVITTAKVLRLILNAVKSGPWEKVRNWNQADCNVIKQELGESKLGSVVIRKIVI